ncbi:MAG: AAA family ATPase [Anaerolineales bacterium]|nr:AAA family ATPase [Anaerolineales bacterium]
MLRIHLFGAPAVYDETGKPVVIPRRLTRALLYYLAAQGRPVTRDHLIDRFWPDEPLEKARASLRDALGKVREALPEKNLLQATRESVTLDFQRISVDLLEMQALLETVQTTCRKLPEQASLPAETYRQMLRLMQLWDGRGFLPGGDVEYSDALSDWMRETEETLGRQLSRLARRLAAHEATAGHPDQANRWLRQALQFDEFDAEVHQAILENYLKSDALKEAREYYESLEEIYGDAADYPPGVRAMEGRIYASPSSDLPALPPDWNVRQSLQAPFIGQEELLEQMERAYRIGGGVLIYGEAGSGKTRLVQEFFRRQRGFPRLMLASCQPLETGMPFAPWIRLLRNSISPTEWRQLGPNWVDSLALLLPELNRWERTSSAPQKAPDVSRGALLEAIHRVLLLAAKRDPLILFLDDVHWADESTLAIVSYLLREEFFSQGRGLLVLTARIEEPNPQLDRFLLTPYPQPMRRLEMRALTPEEIAELCEQVLSRPLPFSIIEQLLQDTGGNPFFLLEILSRLQEMHPADALADAENLPLPASISELVKTRLAALSSEARELLLLGAVMGSSFEVALLEKAVSFSPEAVIDALETLEASRLIRSLPGDRPMYAFRHEKIRESLLSELSPGRKRLLNQKCALALEMYYGPERESVAAKLALHYEAAGEWVKAFTCWKAAARNAYRLASFYECVEAYHRAERLLSRAIGLNDEQIYELYVHWMTLAFDNDDAPELERLSQSLGVLGRERASDLLTGASFTALSQAHMARNQFEQAYQAAMDGFSHVVRSGNLAEMARLMVWQGTSLLMLGRIEEARRWFLRALETTQSAQEATLITYRADAKCQMSIIENLAGFPSRALDYARQSIEEAETVGYLYGKILAHSAQALAYYLHGEPAKGREACLRGLSLLGQLSIWRTIAYLDIYCAMNELEMGLIGPAWKHAHHAIELGRKYGHGEITALGYVVLGDLHTHLQHFDKALQAYEQSYIAAGAHFIRCMSLHRRGYALVRQGHSSGLVQVSQAFEIAKTLEMGGLLLLVATSELSALADAGDAASFEPRAEWFLSEAPPRLGAELPLYTIKRLRARLLLRQGKPVQALEMLANTIAWYHDHQYRWLELECLQIQAQALEANGQNAASVHAQIEDLLDELENGLEDAPILFEWQTFWENYRRRL